jgi:hypothetical protein
VKVVVRDKLVSGNQTTWLGSNFERTIVVVTMMREDNVGKYGAVFLFYICFEMLYSHRIS